MKVRKIVAATLVVGILLTQNVYAQQNGEGADFETEQLQSTGEMDNNDDSNIEETLETEFAAETAEVLETETEAEVETVGGNVAETVLESEDGTQTPEMIETDIQKEVDVLEDALTVKEKSGWVQEGENTYYYENGDKCIGEKKISGKWYYFSTEGVMQTGFAIIPANTWDKKKVYYGPDGAMRYGLQVIDGDTYYFHPVTGDMQRGEQKLDGKWYYFQPVAGNMQTGFMMVPVKSGGNKIVYYGADGAMRYGEQKIDGNWYYLDPVTGARKKGFAKIPVKSGGTKTVYYGPDGTMKYGEQKINGKWYYFHPVTGAMQTGFVKVPVKSGGTKTVYYGSDGSMRYGDQLIGEDWYYFHPVTGAMQTGLVYFEDDTVIFYGSDGKWVDIMSYEDAEYIAYEYLKANMSSFEKNDIESTGADVYMMSEGPFMVEGKEYPQYFITFYAYQTLIVEGKVSRFYILYRSISVDAFTGECEFVEDRPITE